VVVDGAAVNVTGTSSAEWPDLNRRNLVRAGTGAPHQLPGVISNVSSIASVQEDLGRHSSALPFRQHNGSDLYQS